MNGIEKDIVNKNKRLLFQKSVDMMEFLSCNIEEVELKVRNLEELECQVQQLELLEVQKEEEIGIERIEVEGLSRVSGE